MYVDSHTHLDHCLPEGRRSLRDAAGIVAEATQAGVTSIIQSGTDVASSLWAVHAAAALPTVWASVGFHPHDASRAEEDALACIAALTAHPRVVAVGEIGLDYHYDHSPRAAQREAFVWLLELARDASLPAVIHSREADDDTMRLLAEHARDIDVVLHCFALPHRLDEVVERGYYVSFAGNVTYKNATALQEAARLVPDHLLLVETDAPYLSPVPHRGRPNRPRLVVDTYRFLAELREDTVEEVAAQVRRNVERVFPRLHTP